MRKVSEKVDLLGHLQRSIALIDLALRRRRQVELRRDCRVEGDRIQTRSQKRSARFRQNEIDRKLRILTRKDSLLGQFVLNKNCDETKT